MLLYQNRPAGTVDRARQLRRDASLPERRLLRALREACPRLKWRHQAPIGPYFADILCFSTKLVIEVDGDTHGEAQEYDARRTAFLTREGFQVMRFTNEDVVTNLNGALTNISLSLQERGGRDEQRREKGEADRYAPRPQTEKGVAA